MKVVIHSHRHLVPIQRAGRFRSWLGPRQSCVGVVPVRTVLEFETTLAAMGNRPPAAGTIVETPDGWKGFVKYVMFVMPSEDDPQPHFKVVAI